MTDSQTGWNEFAAQLVNDDTGIAAQVIVTTDGELCGSAGITPTAEECAALAASVNAGAPHPAFTFAGVEYRLVKSEDADELAGELGFIVYLASNDTEAVVVVNNQLIYLGLTAPGASFRTALIAVTEQVRSTL